MYVEFKKSVQSNIANYYSDFVSCVLRDIPSVIVPIQRISNNHYFNQLAEINAIEHKPMYMDDYVKQLDMVLSSGGGQLLIGAGSVSHKKAIDKAKSEYRKYQEITLTPVEQAYLDSIKEASKEVKKNKFRH